MSHTMLVIIITIVAVGLFTLAISLTLIIKGHNIDSEIGDNKHMKERGIKCAAQQMREEENEYMGKNAECNLNSCTPGGCGTCGEPHANDDSAQKA